MRFAALGQFLVVLGQAAVPAEPRQRPLHPPADREQDEAHLLGQLADDDHAPAELGLDPVLELAGVGAVHPEQLKPREFAVRADQQVEAGVPILNVRGLHQRPQQQPERVDQDVAFAAVDQLSPRRSRARRRLRWSSPIDCPGSPRWAGGAVRPRPARIRAGWCCGAPRCHPGPTCRSSSGPCPNTGTPWGAPPVAAGPFQVEQAVDDLAQADRVRPTGSLRPLRRGQQRLKECRLAIGQVGRVGAPIAQGRHAALPASSAPPALPLLEHHVVRFLITLLGVIECE